MKYEVTYYGKRYGNTYRNIYPNYTNAWRFGEKLRKLNIHYIINPVNK